MKESTTKEKKDKIMTVRVTKSFKEFIEGLDDRYGKNDSEKIRNIVLYWLSENSHELITYEILEKDISKIGYWVPISKTMLELIDLAVKKGVGDDRAEFIKISIYNLLKHHNIYKQMENQELKPE